MQTQAASEAGQTGNSDSALLTIAALREQGAQQFDPVRWRFIEALERRSAGHGGELKRSLDHKLAQALTAFSMAFEKARDDAVASEPARPGEPMDPTRGPLAELVSQITNQDGAPQTSGALAELKTMRSFRTTWSRLSVDQQLSRSQERVPENPGPLNSHLLVLRSLKLMQQISPAYLKRFMSQVEALLWLDQASFGSVGSAPGKTVPRDNSRGKRKPGK